VSWSGNCWDNAAIESFFSTLKTERTVRKTYRTRDQSRADVLDYIEHFYNPKRRHSTLGYLSLVEFEKQMVLDWLRNTVTRTGSSSPCRVSVKTLINRHRPHAKALQHMDMRRPATDKHQILLYRPTLLHRRHHAPSGPTTIVCGPRYSVSSSPIARIGSTRRSDSGRRTKPCAS
jgi:hypothetical protein